MGGHPTPLVCSTYSNFLLLQGWLRQSPLPLYPLWTYLKKMFDPGACVAWEISASKCPGSWRIACAVALDLALASETQGVERFVQVLLQWGRRKVHEQGYQINAVWQCVFQVRWDASFLPSFYFYLPVMGREASTLSPSVLGSLAPHVNILGDRAFTE